jgi:aarF domain-containing kinase
MAQDGTQSLQPSEALQATEHSSLIKSTQASVSASIRRDEPSLIAKLTRRAQVFLLAGHVFVSYKIVQYKEKRLRSKLGLSEDDDDHPQITALWDDAHELNAKRLLSGIERLQGFWVKLGQYISTRADVMPKQYLTTLSSLQDGVPSKPFQDIRKTLDEQLSPEALDLLQDIDPTPLSTASLAQVHRATLQNGHKVVIKAQHRGVASLMLQDMENLRTILHLLSKSDPDLDYTPVVEEYTKEVTKELDFRQEAQNMKQVKAMLQQEGIRAIIPETIDGLVTEKVMVMDYCEGFSIRDTDSLDKYNADRRLLLERVCQSWAAQMHLLGIFNADPHSGNILVSTSQKDGDASVPVLLDFGLTKRFSPEMKLAFSKLVHSAYETDVDGLLQSFEEMGLKLNRHDPFEDMAMMQKSFSDPVPQSQAASAKKERIKERKIKEEAMRKDQGVDKGQKLRNPVDAWPPELIFFTRVTAMLKGLCSSLEVRYPYLDCMAEAASETLRQSVPEHERAVDFIHPSLDHIDTNLQKRVRDVAKELLEEKQAVGLQLCVISRGETIVNVAAGTLGTVNSRPVTASSLFNVFSVSKAVLATGALVMLEKYGISVDETIAKYWPAFGESHPDKKLITIRHALSHQAGLANVVPENVSIDMLTDWRQMKDFIAGPNAIPSHVPGNETHYHYLSFAWLVGGLIEEITGEPYEKFLHENLLDPLEISEELMMGGLPDEVEIERLAVLTARSLRSPNRDPPAQVERTNQSPEQPKLAKFQGREQIMNPSVFNMRSVRSSKLPSANGHASAHALATLMNVMISQGNSNEDTRILSPESLEEARIPQQSSTQHGVSSAMLDNVGASFGLGFQLHDMQLSDGTVVRSLGHAGFGGSIVIGVPELQLSIAYTTNQLNFKSEARNRLLKTVLNGLGVRAPTSLVES